MATQKSTDVLVVGELNVDLILNGMPQLPVVGKEVLADQMDLTMGSSSAIFASNLSTLGTRVAFIGRLGTDSFGDLMLTSLNAKGVDTKAIMRSPDYPTGITVILNFGEDRAMVTHTGAMKHLTVADVTDEAILSARHLHMSSVFLQEGIYSDVVSLFHRAKQLGLTTSLDPQWDPSEKWNLPWSELLPFVDVFMPNIAELSALTGTDDLTLALRSLKSFANKVVVKSGSVGAYLWENDSMIFQPSFLNKNVIDSIGAGDSFDSGFIHYYLLGKTDQECLEFGALTGAINTTRAGGTTAFANIAMVRSIAQSTFNHTF